MYVVERLDRVDTRQSLLADESTFSDMKVLLILAIAVVQVKFFLC